MHMPNTWMKRPKFRNGYFSSYIRGYLLLEVKHEDNIRVIKLNSVKYESPVVKVKSLAKK